MPTTNTPSTPDMPEDEWLTIWQVAAMLPGCPHVGTVTRWTQKPIRGHVLPSTLIGGKRLVKRVDLDAFIETSNTHQQELPSQSKNVAVTKNAAIVEAMLCRDIKQKHRKEGRKDGKQN